jgi:protein SDA1
MDLGQLQELIKRDPAAYREDFLIQQRHFLSQLQIFQLKPTDEHGVFSKLINFMSHVRISRL